jgi:hypothetical protein
MEVALVCLTCLTLVSRYLGTSDCLPDRPHWVPQQDTKYSRGLSTLCFTKAKLRQDRTKLFTMSELHEQYTIRQTPSGRGRD